MNPFQQVFGRRKVLLPVVHVTDPDQASHNVAKAAVAGADGVFLINHDVSPHILQDSYRYVRSRYPDFWIGMNILGMGPAMMLCLPEPLQASGIWTDNAGIDEAVADPARHARITWEVLQDHRRERFWKGLYFGGVAFKYQQPVKDLAKVAQLAIPYMDVITTSGRGTGEAPDVEKIRTIRRAIGDEHTLAIASGITIDNVGEFLPYSDCFIVATGISDSHTQLNRDAVDILARKIHNWF